MEGEAIEDDTNYVYEDYMKKVVMETFSKCKENLIARLESEAIGGTLNLE